MEKVEPDYSQYQPGDDSFAAGLGARQRRRLFEVYARFSGLKPEHSVLDVGVTGDASYASNNYFEELYPHKAKVTAAGMDPQSYLTQRYPGLSYVQIAPGPLPFADGAFDYAHASAVIEHVGSRAQQQAFLAELWRVSRRGVLVTTPNRWAPVEFHTVLPFLHWLPAPWFRACLRVLGKGFYAEEANLHLLTKSDLRRLGAAAGMQNIQVQGVRLFGWTSNLWLSAQRPTTE